MARKGKAAAWQRDLPEWDIDNFNATNARINAKSSGPSVSSRRKAALKKSRGQQKRGLTERMAQAEVNGEMKVKDHRRWF